MQPVLSVRGVGGAAARRGKAGASSGTCHSAALGLLAGSLSLLVLPAWGEELSRNQQATFDAISSSSSSSSSSNSILASILSDLSGSEATDLLDRLSGDAHAGYVSSLMLADLDLLQAPLGNLRRNLSDPDGGLPYWIRAYRGQSRLDDDGNAGKAKQKFDGMMLGGDLPIPGDWRLGAAFGYGEERLDVDSRDAKADSDSYRYALYGGRDLDLAVGALKFSGGAGYSRHEIDSRRSVDVIFFEEEFLTRRYDVTTRQAFGELAYHLDFSKPAYIEPFFGLLSLEQRSDSFQERGGEAALSAQSQRNRLLSTSTGVRGQQVFQVVGRELLLYGSFTWRQLNGDLRPEMQFSFEDGDSFKVRGNELPRNSYLVELNADYKLTPNIVLDVDYSGVFSDSSRSNSFAVNLRWKM